MKYIDDVVSAPLEGLSLSSSLLTDLAPDVMRALCERVAGLRRL